MLGRLAHSTQPILRVSAGRLGGVNHRPNDQQSRILVRACGAACSSAGGHRWHLRRTRDRLHTHQGAPIGERRKKGEAAQAVGRSRGGRTSKIHALADACGRPVAFALTPGNIADITVAPVLLAAVAAPARLLADKAYDADAFRDLLNARSVEPVILSTASRKRPYPLDRRAYRRRNRIERMFCRIKDWRRIATRYDPRSQLPLSPRPRRNRLFLGHLIASAP
jgi:transposase